MLGHCYKIFKLLTLKGDTMDNVELQTKQSICIFENMIEWIDLILMTMNKIALNINILDFLVSNSIYILLHMFILQF